MIALGSRRSSGRSSTGHSISSSTTHPTNSTPPARHSRPFSRFCDRVVSTSSRIGYGRLCLLSVRPITRGKNGKDSSSSSETSCRGSRRAGFISSQCCPGSPRSSAGRGRRRVHEATSAGDPCIGHVHRSDSSGRSIPPRANVSVRGGCLEAFRHEPKPRLLRGSWGHVDDPRSDGSVRQRRRCCGCIGNARRGILAAAQDAAVPRNARRLLQGAPTRREECARAHIWHGGSAMFWFEYLSPTSLSQWTSTTGRRPAVL